MSMAEKTVRIGILGVAHLHAHSYTKELKRLPGVEVAGIADHDPERAAAEGVHLGVTAFPDAAALLRADLDGVVICAENVRHRELVEMAAASRVHVLSEKPLATTVEDAEAMVRVCRESGTGLYTAFPCRFHPVYARLRQTVQGGEIGRPIAARTTNQGRNPGSWFINKALSGGGAVMDHTVHVADLLRDLTAAEPTEVYAETSNRIGHGPVEDVALLHIGFSNGLWATLDASWAMPKSYWTWGNVTVQVTGTGGVAGMDMFSQNHVVFSDKTMRAGLTNWGDSADGLMLRAFLAAMAGAPAPGPVPLATGEDGLRAVRVVMAAYQSAATREPVTI